MKRFLAWLVGLPAAILIIGFAIANRNWVDIAYDPFDRNKVISLPLWTVTVVGLFLGIFTGWVAAWLKQAKWRRLARELRSENGRLRVENTRLEQERPVIREPVDQAPQLIDGP